MNLILLLLVLALLVGALPAWPYSQNWGYFPSGVIGLIVLLLIVMTVLRGAP